MRTWASSPSARAPAARLPRSSPGLALALHNLGHVRKPFLNRYRKQIKAQRAELVDSVCVCVNFPLHKTVHTHTPVFTTWPGNHFYPALCGSGSVSLRHAPGAARRQACARSLRARGPAWSRPLRSASWVAAAAAAAAAVVTETPFAGRRPWFGPPTVPKACERSPMSAQQHKVLRHGLQVGSIGSNVSTARQDTVQDAPATISHA